MCPLHTVDVVSHDLPNALLLGVQHYHMASWHKMPSWLVSEHHMSEYETRIFNFGGAMQSSKNRRRRRRRSKEQWSCGAL